MTNSYVNYMCSSLISTLFDNKSIKDNDAIFLHLVNKNNHKKELKCNKDNIEIILSRILQFKNISSLCSHIDIISDNKVVNSIEIV